MFSYFLKKTLKKHDANNNRKLNAMVGAAQLRHQALTSNEPGVGNDKQHSIVVSLTSFDKRINDLYLCIESLFQQFVKADKIVLWLSRKNFPDEELPESLLRMTHRGLKIIFHDEDLGPYKKFYYALQEYPESLIITVDDDILYPPDMIDQLYRSWLKRPDVVHCNRGYQMPMPENGKLRPYGSWPSTDGTGEPGFAIFPTGIAGVLYFPGCFDAEVLNKDLFMQLCPNADDVWLKAMTLKHGIKCQRVVDPRDWKTRFLPIEGPGNISLSKINWHPKNGNDAKLKAVFDHFGLYDKLG